jgi:hypothetical protein
MMIDGFVDAGSFRDRIEPGRKRFDGWLAQSGPLTLGSCGLEGPHGAGVTAERMFNDTIPVRIPDQVPLTIHSGAWPSERTELTVPATVYPVARPWEEADAVLQPCWSPDGTKVVFVTSTWLYDFGCTSKAVLFLPE